MDTIIFFVFFAFFQYSHLDQDYGNWTVDWVQTAEADHLPAQVHAEKGEGPQDLHRRRSRPDSSLRRQTDQSRLSIILATTPTFEFWPIAGFSLVPSLISNLPIKLLKCEWFLNYKMVAFGFCSCYRSGNSMKQSFCSCMRNVINFQHTGRA